jgi:hypothetical protein
VDALAGRLKTLADDIRRPKKGDLGLILKRAQGEGRGRELPSTLADPRSEKIAAGGPHFFNTIDGGFNRWSQRLWRTSQRAFRSSTFSLSPVGTT